LTRTERLGAGVSVLGLLFLALSLTGGGNQSVPGSIIEIGAWLSGSAVLAALALVIAPRLFGAAAAYSIAGGLLFSCGDISVKAATHAGARFAFGGSAIAGYALGTSLLQIAYQRGGALTTAGIAQLLTNALPIAAGPVLFGEPVPQGGLGVLRVLAFAAVVTAAVLLARPEEKRGPTGDETQ
jgi:hypothetical protein